MSALIFEDGFSSNRLFNRGYSYTYDDVIFLPHYIDFPTDSVHLASNLSRCVPLSIPCVSSPMDTVTESHMAISMAALGGIGIIHSNLTSSEQAHMVRSVKSRRVLLLSNPSSNPQAIKSNLTTFSTRRIPMPWLLRVASPIRSFWGTWRARIG
ncbi:hypothetical protein ACFX2F_004309 [Malus domestica]